VSPEPEFFRITEASEARPASGIGDGARARVASVLAHLLILAVMLFGSSEWFSSEDSDESFSPRVRFYFPGGEGPGGGGGGGGSGGKRPTAYIPTRMVEAPPPAETAEPKRAPVAPRKPRALKFDDLDVPDLPTESMALFEGVFSPDSVEFPGLSTEDSRDWGGVDTEPSSGTGGGIGGGTGSGVGTGEGWGVGPGRGGGTGGGDFSPGGWDIEPVPIYQPPSPPYPSVAREKMVAGEVILQVLVRLDGSTEVVRVIKSLPYCVDAAKENAKHWRWKPALKNGKPVEALGIITVTFDIFAQGNAKS
jgi:Gram-negative bacterial TonB protein C-terminal